jgi:hypothetical protein
MVVKFQKRYCKTLQASNAVDSDAAKPAPVRNEFWLSGRYTYHYFRVWRKPMCGFICTVETGKNRDSAAEHLFSGKTLVGLPGVKQPQRWSSAQGSAAENAP